MENQGQPINSQQLSYEQFQAQVQQQQEQQRIQAQQALRNVGLDPRSQQISKVVIELQSIQSELQLAENQIGMQMDAQKRQIQSLQQRLQQAVTHVQSTFGANTNTNAASGSDLQPPQGQQGQFYQ
ncbi:hypothetical protein K0T92_22765 [Paenibacillus oenotherae]|uniref:Uncharacterized protein n=1 Tax=Paenibacillus oenotherae TaxID=1435645 RepID=A0ABS7DD16_9BACL|nr:hypothetical protein [Paenibacillus oenotherae]MBW7477546.1 hypothetical protein [Paenibacillus oenotherae]